MSFNLFIEAQNWIGRRGFAHRRHCAQIKESLSSSMSVCSRSGQLSNPCVNQLWSGACWMWVWTHSLLRPQQQAKWRTSAPNSETDWLIVVWLLFQTSWITNNMSCLSPQCIICHGTLRFLYLQNDVVTAEFQIQDMKCGRNTFFF